MQFTKPLCSILTSVVLCVAVPVHADEPIIIPQLNSDAPPAAVPNGAPAAAHGPALSPSAWHHRWDETLRRNWGIEVLGVHTTSSGWMLKFEYRILDAGKATLLNEKRSKAFIIDEATDVRLSVPAMENIGELRQTPRPEEGRVYYIIFGNPGQLVKRGGRVDVIVGRFRADGIQVE